MKAPPLLFGGCSPVVAYFRHSMTVVFPEPLYPTIRVSGVKNWMVSLELGANERMPWMDSLSILDMEGRWAMDLHPTAGGTRTSIMGITAATG